MVSSESIGAFRGRLVGSVSRKVLKENVEMIYLRVGGEPFVRQVRLSTHRWGADGHVIVKSGDNVVWLDFMGNIVDLVGELRRLTEELEQMVCTGKDGKRVNGLSRR